MESWGNLLSNLEGDEIEGIFQSVSDHRLDNSTDPTRPSLDGVRHDSGVSVISAKEEDTKTAPSPQNTTSSHETSGSVVAKASPTREDFDNALWVTTKVNGITQYRAPRYTTSPTTNPPHITILNPSIAKESTAIDLSTSPSSFALQCASVGFFKTLCWDTNPWNIEGLKRSCVKNEWNLQIHHGDDRQSKRLRSSLRSKIVAFVEGQDSASSRVEKMRDQLPPIRCVRCEDSSTSQATAAAALDPALGGWIYVQAAFGTEFVISSANQIRGEFEEMINILDNKRGFWEAVRRPRIEYIQRGGSYAAGVVSCVIVIYIPSLRI
ncbi:hypothetical protein D6D21_02352 [Aureobasidium pullulans]|uniref:S-adenosyl-L-methionine-dependent methyltransferase n=1 Tax=Aureobasidium pullulans TaxID=5580 RepID=A0AB74J5X5_AURPU|nr:hypothetical protein D6D21_02352 [Aureobasidium pullulans]